MQAKQIRSLAMGLWQTELFFRLSLVGGLWLPEKYLDRHWNHQSTTRHEMDILQRSQNKVMRILLGEKDPLTPTTTLLQATNMLSVSQLSFVATATLANQAVVQGKPQWLYCQLKNVQASQTNEGGVAPIRCRTNLRGEGLAAKVAKVFNMLPENI